MEEPITRLAPAALSIPIYMVATVVSPQAATTSGARPVVCQLPSGLTIVAERIPVAAICLNVWLQVGSAMETDAANGMAHFLEHMIFKGTDTLAPGEFDRRVEARGAVMNAATSQDYTQYFITTAPQDFVELAPLQLELVARARLPEQEFERERSVVLEEIRRSQDNPGRCHYARTMATCFERLPYRRPVLGSAESVGNLSVAQMQAFHKRWYRPAATTVAVVGDLPVETLIETVRASFPAAAGAPSPIWVPPTPEAAFADPTRCETEAPALQQARLTLLWRVPGLAEFERTYALDVLAAILGQGRMSRLFRELREERQWVNAIGAYNATQKLQGHFYVSARLPVERLDCVEATIREQIDRLQQEPVRAEELARIRTQVANRFVFANERPGDRASSYGYYQSQLGSIAAALEYPQRIQALQAEDLLEAARHHLSPKNCATVISRPL